MKQFVKMLLFVGLVSSFRDCHPYFNVIQHYSDEFKKTETFILNQHFTPDEKKSLVKTAFITYQKQKSKVSEKITLFFVFQRNLMSFNIDKKGFIKTNDRSFEIDGKNLNTENVTQTVTNNNIIVLDSTGVQTALLSSNETTHWLQDKFQLELSDEIAQMLRNGQDLKFRFYSGAIPITFTVKNKDWLILKNWLKS
ncbi:MAG: hypothetical protein RLZZ628_2995 [Bacteroidota bacterium]|jgi:hypothetical protein